MNSQRLTSRTTSSIQAPILAVYASEDQASAVEHAPSSLVNLLRPRYNVSILNAVAMPLAEKDLVNGDGDEDMEEGDTNDIAQLESLADEYEVARAEEDEELGQDQENQNASDGGSGTADENGRAGNVAGQEQQDEVDHVMEAIRAALARRRPSPDDPYSSCASDWDGDPI